MSIKVPNTISDKEMTKLRKAAEKVAPPLLSTEAVRRRKTYAAQMRKAGLN